MTDPRDTRQVIAFYLTFGDQPGRDRPADYAPHVKFADFAVLIGPGSADDSCLLFYRILAAAQASGLRRCTPAMGFCQRMPISPVPRPGWCSSAHRPRPPR